MLRLLQWSQGNAHLVTLAGNEININAREINVQWINRKVKSTEVTAYDITTYDNTIEVDSSLSLAIITEEHIA